MTQGNKKLPWVKAAKVTAIEYFQNTSLTGFKLLFSLKGSKILQFIWIPFLCLGLIAGIYTAGHCILFFQLSPTITYIHSFNQPVEDVPFPGVSICSVNKISKQAFTDYINSIADTVFSYNSESTVDRATFFKKFHLFGGFYDYSGFDADDAYELQSFYEKIVTPKTGLINTTELLEKLAPECKYLLRKCSWAGQIQPCADLFSIYPTPEGFCCIFNYNRTVQRKKTPLRHLSFTGEDHGLKILLNTSTSDYFFTQRSFIGFIVQIFNGLSLPDIRSGKLSEFPVSPNMNILSSISVTSLSSEEEIKEYTVGQRRCYFANEFPNDYGTHYNQPECMFRCKIQSIVSLCNCVPYYVPEDYVDWSSPVIYCTLSNLECLTRYKLKWISYRPSKRTLGLEQEMEDALSCTSCLPLCEENQYAFQLDKASFKPDSLYTASDTFLTNETELENSSLLRIYYTSPYILQYRQRLVYSGNSLLANIGGILSVSIGCSLISIIEIFYFATYRFYLNLKKFQTVVPVEKGKEDEKISRNELKVYSLD